MNQLTIRGREGGFVQRQCIRNLLDAGFYEIPGGAKGSHRKYSRPRYPGAVTLSGGAGDDAKHYQERQIRRAIDLVQQ